MEFTSRFGVPPEHDAEAESLTRRLHEQGWASHVTVGRLLQEWEQLAGEVAAYKLTIGDYTNDLTTRDALEQVIAWASPTFAALLRSRVDRADERFKEATSADGGAAVGRYFRIERHPGLWWRRRPTTGALATYLDGA